MRPDNTLAFLGRGFGVGVLPTFGFSEPVEKSVEGKCKQPFLVKKYNGLYFHFLFHSTRWHVVLFVRSLLYNSHAAFIKSTKLT